MDILTIIVLLIFLICLVNGIRKGFLRILFSVLTLVLCIVLTSHFATPFAEYLRTNTKLYDNLYAAVYSSVDHSVQAPDLSETDQDVQDAAKQAESDSTGNAITNPALQNAFSEQIQAITESIAGSFNDSLTEMKDSAVANVATAIADPLFLGLVRLILFALIWLILKLLYSLLSLGLHHRGISAANRLLGGALGLAEAFLICWLILAVITIGQTNTSAYVQSLTENPFVHFLYRTDPFHF